MKEITSLQNPLVKHLVKLRKERQYRNETRFLVIEGKKLVNEVCAGIKAKNILYTNPDLVSDKVKTEVCYQVSEEVIKKISGVRTPEGVIAEVPIPEEGEMAGIQHLVAFDGVSDPGNMGTLIRTALALGWEGAYILSNCCDPYNDKALRSAKGATFRLPLKFGNWEELDHIVEKNELYSIAADIEGTDVCRVSGQKRVLLVLGSESSGLSEETLKRCEKITVPMSGEIESLNVSIAGGILMYLIKNQ